MRFPACSVNQIIPSGPWIGVCGPEPSCGSGYSVKRSVFGSKAAILLPRCSVTYSRASEAQAMPCGRPSAVGTDHSVNLSVRGSNRPSLLAPISANQMRPSGAATRQWGALFGVGMAYSTMDGLAVSPMRSEEHTSELQSLAYLVCRLLLEKKKTHK